MLARLAVSILLLSTTGAVFANSPAPSDHGLRTVSEQSGFLRTGRYEEVIALCAAYEKNWPDAVRCIDFGRTPEGRPMKALVASRSGALDAATARERGLPVLLVQGGIHAGEIDGKDAGFLALREALENKAAKGALDKLVLVFVPVFNVDGHERFRRWNRPNQRGPEEMGWRTTAQNFNLNRDYAKADTLEMQAMLALVNVWDPIAYIDLHVTDGAKFEHDISVQVEPLHAGDAELRGEGKAMQESVLASLRKSGSLPLAFYPSFVENDNPASGFVDGVSPPRFSTGYFHLRNRFGMLVETHSWKDYPTRVRITRNTIIAMLEQTAINGGRWRQAAERADTRSANPTGQTIALDYVASDKTRTIDFRGYEYTRTPSEVSGALMTRYDDSKPQLWRLPLRDEVIAGRTIAAPLGGYLVPASQAAMVSAKLQQHGITFRTLDSARTMLAVQAFRAEKATPANQSVEGHQRMALEGHWSPETRDVPAGSLFVPIAQAKAALVVALLEPQAPDSLAAWGAFNNAFEQKEYMEDYVAEEVARAMLAADPALAAAFAKKVADEPDFAKDPSARLQFFYQRHSAWDEQFNLYPVLRSDSVP